MSSSIILNHVTPLGNGRPYYQPTPGSADPTGVNSPPGSIKLNGGVNSAPKSLLKTVNDGGGNVLLHIVDTNNNSILRNSEQKISINNGQNYKFISKSNLSSILTNKTSNNTQSSLLVGFDDDHLPPTPPLQQPSPPGSTTSSTSSTSSCSAATSSTSSSSLTMLNTDSGKKIDGIADDLAVGADYMHMNGNANQSGSHILFDQSNLSSNSFNTTASASSTSYYSTNTSINPELNNSLTNSNTKVTNVTTSSINKVNNATASNDNAQKSQKSKKRVQFISEEKLDETNHRSSSSSPKISIPVNKRNSRADQAQASSINTTTTPAKAGSTLPFAARDLNKVQLNSILVNTRPNDASVRSSSLRKVSIKLNTMESENSRTNMKSLDNLPSDALRGAYQMRQASSNVGSLLIKSPLVNTARPNNVKSHSYIVSRGATENTNTMPSSMSTSTTMPAISSAVANASMAATRKNFSSYTLSEKDNPFRPEGQLAKEANEFLKEMKEKAEKEVNTIIQTTLNNSSLLNTSGENNDEPTSPSKNAAASPATKTSLNANNNKKQSTSTPVKQDAANASSTNKTSEPFSISTPTTPTKPQSPTTKSKNNKDEPQQSTTPSSPSKSKSKSKSNKDDKTKPKCGCTIS